jgi:serine protease AprX
MTLRRRLSSLLLAGLCVLLGAGSAAAQETYVEKSLKNSGHSTQHVIITIAPGHENEVLATLQRRGAGIKSQHPSINGVSARIHGDDVSELARHGAVSITSDALVHVSAAPAAAKGTTKIALDPNAPQGQTVSTLRLSLGLTAGASSNLASGVVNGSGVGVALVDSGIYPGADFGARIKGFYDFTRLDRRHRPTQPAPYDDHGHGTHVAGLIGSAGAAPGYMFQGVAPNVNLVAFKVLDKNGASSTSTVIAAIEFIIAHRSTLGVQIINLSLGHPVTAPAKFDPLVQAIEQASAHGLTVVVAAGNDGPGYGSINSPANAPSAITVGAADGRTTVARNDDYVPSFSSRGPTWYDGLAKPDVIAPGVNLYSDASPGSTLVNSKAPVFQQETVDGVKLVDLGGSSMAAAVATGVLALEFDANAHQNVEPLTLNAAKAILEYTATRVADADYLTQGAGQINAAGAVQLASSINTLAAVNSWWLQTGVSGSSTIGGQNLPWAQNIIWGPAVLSGRFIYYNNRMWDDNIIWGSGSVRGNNIVRPARRVLGKFFDDNIIWGSEVTVLRKNIVWSTEAADNIIWGSNLAQFRVVGERVGKKIVWGSAALDNIIWGSLNFDNIIWGTNDGDNIIWGTWFGDNIIWGTTADDNIIWGSSSSDDNIIWGTSSLVRSVLKTLRTKFGGDNIIWGTADSDNIIWGTGDTDNIIWGTNDDNIIWGTSDDGDNIIWGTDLLDNIIWGTGDGDNIIWGTNDLLDNIIWGTAAGLVGK